MSNEIAIRTTEALSEKLEWAKAMSTGSMLPRAYQGNPANLLFALEFADTLGIPRINALTSIHVIDGKPTASADLIASLVRKAGHKLRVVGDDTYAEATIIRADDPDFVTTIRWDEAKARTAGKWGSKGPWSNYPGAMLRARAITEVARMAASDALFGVIYTPEELGESETPTVVRQVDKPRPVPEQKPPVVVDMDALISAVEVADLDTLRLAWNQSAGLSDEDKGIVRDLIKARKADIEAEEASEADPVDAVLVDEHGDVAVA